MSTAGADTRDDVLIVGGGIAGVEALMALADLGERRLRLRVLARHPSFVLRPQILGEPWGGPALHVNLEHLCHAFGARFVLATATAVDAAAHAVISSGGERFGYDRLLLAPGARRTLPYAQTRTLGFGLLPELLAAAGHGSVAIVVPPGTSWTLPAYELALLAAGENRDVRVITGEHHPLEAFGPGTKAATSAMLRDHGVTVDCTGAPEPGTCVSDLADTVIALPSLVGPVMEGLPQDVHGFVATDGGMRVPDAEHVFAAGDATQHGIKQGGLAAQQADVAAAEILRSFGHSITAVAYAPVLRGKLTASGGEELYLRRRLDRPDEGETHDRPLWQPSGVVCAWRLARWLEMHRGELAPFTLDHVAAAM